MKQFCKTPSKRLFNKLSNDLHEQMVKTSFDVLFQKTGDQKKALEILQILGEVIAAMNTEYLQAANITLDFDEEKFVNNEDMTISFMSIFKTNPKDEKSKTTLIKWSNDTIPKKYLKKQLYDGTGGRGSYMKAVRYMKSLKDMELPMYPEYGKQERIIYKPNRVN